MSLMRCEVSMAETVDIEVGVGFWFGPVDEDEDEKVEE